MPAEATITAATDTPMTVVRRKDRRGVPSPRRAPAPSISGDAAVNFVEPPLFAELCLERAMVSTSYALVVHCRLYIASASASARVHPARLPRASSRLARAKVAANFAWALCSARLTEPGVGWRSIWAPIDWDAIGPASGLPADCRTASSNCAILSVQGPACAEATLTPKAAMKKAAAVSGFINVLRVLRRR
jgi:hypothetical protein